VIGWPSFKSYCLLYTTRLSNLQLSGSHTHSRTKLELSKGNNYVSDDAHSHGQKVTCRFSKEQSCFPCFITSSLFHNMNFPNFTLCEMFPVYYSMKLINFIIIENF